MEQLKDSPVQVYTPFLAVAQGMRVQAVLAPPPHNPLSLSRPKIDR
jgi:hypothetical protein